MNTLYLREISLRPEAVRKTDYPFSLPVVRRMGTLKLRKAVTLLAGENGVGKSTLIEALAVACGFNAEGGSVNFQFSTRQTHSELGQYLKICRGARRPRDGFFLRSESFYNAASYIDSLEDLAQQYGGSLHGRSHGESFLALVENRFRGQGLYILDEPEAALSPMRLMALMVHIRRLAGQGSQFVIATHSPILMALPEAEVLLLNDEGITAVDYRETEHYQVTKAFMNTPEKMLKELFG